MRALVIEDSPAYRALVVEVFNRIGLQADAVESAEQGLGRLGESVYDFVCLDLQLPEMDGLELCRRLRHLERGELIRVVLLTADSSDSLQQRAFDAGITEILHKTEAEPLQRALDTFSRRIEGRVLYVEDSRSVAGLKKAVMAAAGLQVEQFSAADEALQVFSNGDFELVISDIIVEGTLSGVGLLRAIRSLDNPRRETPFLAVSGKFDNQLKVSILLQGADECIAKPVLKEELLARISKLITRKRLFDQVLEQQQELQRLAITDALTGLYNKAYLNETGGKLLSDSLRHRYPLSLLVINLDHFKQINDEHGHDVGDTVLNRVGNLLKSSYRNEDLPARFGGEEFVLLLTHCSLSSAREKAEQLRASIEALKPEGLSITTSIGVTCTQKDRNTDYQTLFRQADEAVYQAKQGGRNRVVIYSCGLRDTALPHKPRQAPVSFDGGPDPCLR
jgi:two-component system cell cycle response regulator